MKIWNPLSLFHYHLLSGNIIHTYIFFFFSNQSKNLIGNPEVSQIKPLSLFHIRLLSKISPRSLHFYLKRGTRGLVYSPHTNWPVDMTSLISLQSSSLVPSCPVTTCTGEKCWRGQLWHWQCAQSHQPTLPGRNLREGIKRGSEVLCISLAEPIITSNLWHAGLHWSSSHLREHTSNKSFG